MRLSVAAIGMLILATGCTPPPIVGDEARLGSVEQHWPVWYDGARQREVRARVFLPAGGAAADAGTASLPDGAATPPVPLVVFSHGGGESILSYDYLGQHWAAHGYAVLFVEHLGSDVGAIDWDAVTPSLIRAARDPANWAARPRDLAFALDQLAADPALADRIDFTRVAAAGHSYGAQSALALVGLRITDVNAPAEDFRDPRIVACIALSPHGPGVLGLDEHSWEAIQTPLLCIYGTNDGDVITYDASTRRATFDHAVRAERWQAVLPDVEHETFTGRDPAFPFASAAPAQQVQIAALTTAFLDSCLRNGDAVAGSGLSLTLPGLCPACAVESAAAAP